jgi:hypothetical protein
MSREKSLALQVTIRDVDIVIAYGVIKPNHSVDGLFFLVMGGGLLLGDCYIEVALEGIDFRLNIIILEASLLIGGGLLGIGLLEYAAYLEALEGVLIG